MVNVQFVISEGKIRWLLEMKGGGTRFFFLFYYYYYYYYY